MSELKHILGEEIDLELSEQGQNVELEPEVPPEDRKSEDGKSQSSDDEEAEIDADDDDEEMPSEEDEGLSDDDEVLSDDEPLQSQPAQNDATAEFQLDGELNLGSTQAVPFTLTFAGNPLVGLSVINESNLQLKSMKTRKPKKPRKPLRPRKPKRPKQTYGKPVKKLSKSAPKLMLDSVVADFVNTINGETSTMKRKSGETGNKRPVKRVKIEDSKKTNKKPTKKNRRAQKKRR